MHRALAFSYLLNINRVLWPPGTDEGYKIRIPKVSLENSLNFLNLLEMGGKD